MSKSSNMNPFTTDTTKKLKVVLPEEKLRGRPKNTLPKSKITAAKLPKTDYKIDPSDHIPYKVLNKELLEQARKELTKGLGDRLEALQANIQCSTTGGDSFRTAFFHLQKKSSLLLGSAGISILFLISLREFTKLSIPKQFEAISPIGKTLLTDNTGGLLSYYISKSLRIKVLHEILNNQEECWVYNQEESTKLTFQNFIIYTWEVVKDLDSKEILKRIRTIGL
jgi:hypothetical protein